MKNIILIIALVIGFTASAQDKKNKNARFSIEVNGNCEMCKKRIEKAAYEVSGVKSASWDIGTHQLDIILNEEKSALLDVQKSIAKAGHDTPEVKAHDVDYSNLHGCCLYERE